MSERGVEPHGALVQLAPGLHVVDGEWGPLRRRMTVMDSGGGALAVHSAMRLGSSEMARLDALGPVRWILVPNRYHASEAAWYAGRHPEAKLLVPAASRAALAKQRVGPIAGTLEHDWPPELEAALARQPLAGLRFLDEVVFLHRATRTLVLCDLAFNLHGADLGWSFRQAMRLNGAVDRFGPTRFFRAVVLRDRSALLASLRPVLAWDFDRVIVSHGRVLETGGQAAMQAAFSG